MAQKYRIYINEKVILFTQSAPKNAEKYERIDGQTFDLKIIYTWILAHHGRRFYLICDKPKAFLKSVAAHITLIEAAGGLVKNGDGDYLFIYRNDKWDLPKGKVEKDEAIKTAAVREVEEECGITISKLGSKICNTYHAYISRGEVVLKKTYWFRMKYKGNEKLKPQKDEGITDARWFRPGHIDAILQNTFPSILDVLIKKELVKDKSAPLWE